MTHPGPTTADDLLVTMVLDTNRGGVPVTICGCGVLLLCADVSLIHTATCPAFTTPPEVTP